MMRKLTFLLSLMLCAFAAFAQYPADIAGTYLDGGVYTNNCHSGNCLTITNTGTPGAVKISGFFQTTTQIDGTYDAETGVLTIPAQQVIKNDGGNVTLTLIDGNYKIYADIVFQFDARGNATLVQGEGYGSVLNNASVYNPNNKWTLKGHKGLFKANGTVVISDESGTSVTYPTYTFINGNSGWVMGIVHNGQAPSWWNYTFNNNNEAQAALDYVYMHSDSYGPGKAYRTTDGGAYYTSQGPFGAINRDAGTITSGPYQYLLDNKTGGGIAGRVGKTYINAAISFPAINVASSDASLGTVSKAYNGSYMTLTATSKGGDFKGWYDADGNLVSNEATFTLNFSSENAGTYTARFELPEIIIPDCENPAASVLGTFVSGTVDNHNCQVSNVLTITAGDTEGAVKIAGFMKGNQQIDATYDAATGHLTIPGNQVINVDGNGVETRLALMVTPSLYVQSQDIVFNVEEGGHGYLAGGQGLAYYTESSVTRNDSKDWNFYEANGTITSNQYVKNETMEFVTTTEYPIATIFNEEGNGGTVYGIENACWLKFDVDAENNVQFEWTDVKYYSNDYTNAKIHLANEGGGIMTEQGITGTLNMNEGTITTNWWVMLLINKSNSAYTRWGNFNHGSVITFPAINAVSSDSQLGTVKKTYNGLSVTLTATPVVGCEFQGWYDANGTCLTTETSYTMRYTPGNAGTYTARFGLAGVEIADCENPAASALGTFVSGTVDNHGCNNSNVLTITAGETEGAVKVSGFMNGNQQIDATYDATTGHLTIPGNQVVNVDTAGVETRLAIMVTSSVYDPSQGIVFNVEDGGHGYPAGGKGLAYYTNDGTSRTDSKDWNFYMANGTIKSTEVQYVEGVPDSIGTTEFATATIFNADGTGGVVYGIEGCCWLNFTIDEDGAVGFPLQDAIYSTSEFSNARLHLSTETGGYYPNIGLTGNLYQNEGYIQLDRWVSVRTRLETNKATLLGNFKSGSIITFPGNAPALKGDVDGDGVVDIADVNLLINIMLGAAEATPNADVDGDGVIDIADVNTIINIMLGGETE
ncbi:MAG: hypothetical protein KBT10_08650 [Bacteroidales bacterium]|nr:hypothetical protein [Candidatus Sodaliphilus aphodohippi]